MMSRPIAEFFDGYLFPWWIADDATESGVRSGEDLGELDRKVDGAEDC